MLWKGSGTLCHSPFIAAAHPDCATLCRAPQHAETLKIANATWFAMAKLEVGHDHDFEGLLSMESAAEADA